MLDFYKIDVYMKVMVLYHTYFTSSIYLLKKLLERYLFNNDI